MNTKKIIIIIVLIFIGLASAYVGLLFWQFQKETFTLPTNESTQTQQEDIVEGSTNISPKTEAEEDAITNAATQGVLPEINTNPLEEKPDLNPADKANPFKNVETNPFN